MKQIFLSKRDANGNRYYLILNHDDKTYKTDYNPFFTNENYIETTKKTLKEIKNHAIDNGYKEV